MALKEANFADIVDKDCKHETLRFGSGDYYIFCANPKCFRSWIMKGDLDTVDVDRSNIGVGQNLSGEERKA